MADPESEANHLANSVGAPPLLEENGGPVVVELQHPQTGKKADVKSVLSQAQGKCISESRELYQAVMGMFNELEKKVPADEKITVDSMKSFSSKRNLDAVFARDFPFHLVLAHRISSHKDAYQHDVFTKYVGGCCDRLRTLKKETIASVLLAFHSRGDFPVEDGPAKKSVFKLLQDSSIAIAGKLPIADPKKQLQLNVFSTMALISVSHKCHSRRRAASKVSANWQMCLVEKFQVKLTPAIISELQEGLALGKLLKLPKEMAFCPEWLGSQLMSHNNVQLISALTNLVTAIEPYVSLQEQFIAQFLNLPRGIYSLSLEQEKWKDVCSDGTRISVIRESLHYLDVIHRIVTQHGWLDGHFNEHCEKWLDLLVELVDITDDRVEEHLSEVFNPKLTVTEEFKSYIKNQLKMFTRDTLVKLPEDKFMSIFKRFDFWKTADVEMYFQHYKVSADIDLKRPVWSDMFYFAQNRANGEDDLSFFLGFFKAVAEQYKKKRKAIHFVLDLSHLRSPTPLLFPDETVRMASSQISKAVPGDFATFLHRYIQKNSLCSPLLDHVEDIWKLFSNERNEFQEYVLEVVTKELFSDITIIKGKLRENLSLLFSRAIATVRSMPLATQPQSVLQKFSWCIIATCCERIPAEKENLCWVSEYSAVTRQLGQVLQTSSRQNQPDESSSSQPSDSTLALSDQERYFEWVLKVKDIFLFWKEKFSSHIIMHQEIEMYHVHREEIYKLAEVLQDRTLAVSDSDVASVKNLFLQQFERLNMILIRYNPGSTDAKWCSLMTLLSRYGVTLPHKLQTATSQCVAFPDTDNYSSDQFKSLAPSISARFKPGAKVSLKLCKTTELKQLESIVRSLEHFTEPLCTHIDMLVFFSLKESQLFTRLLHFYLLNETSDNRQFLSSYQEGSFAFDVARPGVATELEDTPTLEMILLQQALRSTRNLLQKLGDGKATYREVTANGALDLRVVKIDQEVDAISEFLEQSYRDVPASYTRVQEMLGPKWLKSILELIEIRKHIVNIYSVASKFNITGCLTDENLKQLVFMAKSLESDLSVRDLTLADANDKMGVVKEQLCITKDSDYEFLDLFPVLAESVPFHNFLHSQNFSGFEGQERFKQEIQLITGHLQHADYSEIVLNHLILAYEYMVPFIDHDQNLHSLMLKVFSQHLVAENGRKILETVNRNIDLIKLWFSRAKIGIAENTLRELDCVLENGQYRFILQSTSDVVQCDLELKFCLTPEPPVKRATGTIVVLNPENDDVSTNAEEDSDGDGAPKGTLIVWNADEITNFVRKLGFLGAKKVKGKDIKQFQKLYEIALRLSDLHIRLKKLGHTEYLPATVTKSLPCCLSAEEASHEEATTKQLLEECSNTVSELHKKYEWLMFFSVAKVIVLQKMLISEEPEVDSIVEEIAPLLVNTPTARKVLGAAVKKVVTERKYQYFNQTAMDEVGKALDEVFADSAVEEHSINTHTAKGLEAPKPGCCWGVTETQSSIVLHHCPKDSTFSQKHLVMLVISLYQGAPEAFQIFHCQSSTTREEMEFFFKRVSKHPLAYFVIEINHLPLHLQEDFIQLYENYKVNLTDESARQATLHLVESAPSALREIAWIPKQEHKDANLKIGKDEVYAMLKKRVLNADNLSYVQLMYGFAGCGKSHQIRLEVEEKCPHFVKIAVNEAFCIKDAIMKLRTLPREKDCAIVFNFTMTSPHVIVGKKVNVRQFPDSTTGSTEYSFDSFDVAMQELYNQRIEVVRWFFFSLLILGYVEDANCGISFQFPTGLSWKIYVEIPSYDTPDPHTSLEQFTFDVPVLGIVGIHHFIHTANPFTVDSDVRLVCQFLQAFKRSGEDLIDPGSEPVPKDEECRKLLEEYIPDTIRGITPKLKVKENKTAQRLFLKYLKRRCAIINTVPQGRCKFLRKQGDDEEVEERMSSVFKLMLDEVCDICQWSVEKENEEKWSPKLVKQLICGERDGIPTFQLIELDEDDYMKHLGDGRFQDGLFHSYLSHALNIPLRDGRLAPIDDAEYVLTLDYTIKMLHIHERSECGVPVIIEGETGVGKTALIEMLSKLWNYGVLTQWKSKRKSLVELFKQKLGVEVAEGILDSMSTMKERLLGILNGVVGGATNEESREIQSALTDYVLALKRDPISFFLSTGDGKTRESLWDIDNPEALVDVLYRLLMAKPQNAFYKLNVHSALQPINIVEFFNPIFEQASLLQSVFQVQETEHKVPRVTVFLDEVNTSSCLGLLKEIIVDRTINGNAIPSNVFIIAACNPHRADSLATLDDHTSISVSVQETMFRGSYYVQKLPPTLRFLIWDYKALDEPQEREYIRAKVSLLTKFQQGHTQSIADKVDKLTHLIVVSHSLMRSYAHAYFGEEYGLSHEEAFVRSQSYVSQRDIQRVFVFYRWLMKMYYELKPHGETDYSVRAMLVSLALVYYLRLNDTYRAEYQKYLDSAKRDKDEPEIKFSQAFSDELEWYINHIELPGGIAKTQALKENCFAIIVCAMTRTPLIICGPPGCSKTLSFHLALVTLKGEGSKVEAFRSKVFLSLDPHVYQCCRRTTSTEIDTVFRLAINRQNELRELPTRCVVFMDEAGLPEERHESLKVLHQYLDEKTVSFISITNKPLDAAKSNRAVTVFRPETSDQELETLTRGCFASKEDNLPPELQKTNLEKITHFCPAYSCIMRRGELQNFFGLRDFIHFIRYLYRKRTLGLSPNIFLQALERNFNGTPEFKSVCQEFLNQVDISLEEVHFRNILEVLKDSLDDRPLRYTVQNEVRYKIIIDPSEDSSLVRFLFSFRVLDRANTRTLCCSGFLGNSRADKVNAIRAILLSVAEGHTVLLYQTDEIHESFYNLFNQNFRSIDDPEQGTRYFANVAIGPYTKPCLVHPNFQCVVVVNRSELLRIPPPFLNRFEKYVISHKNLIESRMMDLPPLMQSILQTACKKVVSFLDIVHHSSSIYGLRKETVDSLILMLLPPWDHKFEPFTTSCELVSTVPDDPKLTLLETLQDALKKKGGLYIPPCAPEELTDDAHSVFDIVTTDAKFAGCLGSLNHSYIQGAVTEALNAVYFTPPSLTSNTQIPVSLAAALVITVLQQWLVRHLCKGLMLLMTPEALAVYQHRIPASYRINYLHHRDHFSLKNCITKCYENIHKGMGNKLLCYSRSSEFIYGIPNVYPGSKFSHVFTNDKCIENLIFDSPDQVTVLKLQTSHSQSAVSSTLEKFIESEDQKIMVIPVNMKELSRQIVNELRIMIEEAENVHAAQDKLFVILLHFPPAMFTDACYPALFLQGWVHYYFDTIATDTSVGNVDIKSWFQQCAESQTDSPKTLSEALPTMLKNAIPVLASRLTFGSLESCSFNKPMTLPERTKALESVLIKKPLGDVLQSRFLSYWDQATMAKYLRRAATFTRNGESTLNLTDCLQEMLKSSFLDFLLYILTRINQNYNLDILFDSSQEPEMHGLFIAIVEVLPLPDILGLNVAYNAMKKEQFSVSHDIIPKFPFFTLVSEQVEKVLDQSQQEVNQELDVLTESRASVRNQERVIKLLEEAMLKKLATSTDEYIHCFKRAMQAISHSDALWKRYFIDFTHQRLNMVYYEDGISHPLMRAALGTYIQQSADRVIALHVYFQVHELELAKVAILLRSLNKLTQLMSTVPLPASTTMQSFSAQYIKSAEASKMMVGKQDDLTIFITSTLFAAIVGICTTKENERVSEGLLLWYHTYCGVASRPDFILQLTFLHGCEIKSGWEAWMSLPAVKKFIYQYSLESVSPEVEGKLNIMYAAFAVIHLNSSVNELLKAQTVFNSLLRAHFSLEDLKLKVPCPRLKEVASITLAVLTGSVDFRDPQYSKEIYPLLELLFAHFFSEYFSRWRHNDIQWFLEFANEQQHWKLSVTAQESQQGIPMATFIFFLSRLLLERKLPNPNIHPSRNYEPEVVNLVGKVIASGCTGTLGPYIPTFYQKLDDTLQACAKKNELMHQPLSHLYFNTVLEHLLCGEFTLSDLCEIIDKLGQQYRNPDDDNGKRLLFSIEIQAVIQLLLKGMAEHMDAQNPQKIADLSGATPALKRIVSNEKEQSGVAHRHGIVLALHLLRHCHSFSEFTHILTTEYHDICQDLKYLQYFRKPMTTAHHVDTRYLLPFMISSESENAKLHKLYQEVHQALRKAQTTRGKRIELIQQLAEQCAGDEQSKRDFQMMVWLCAYYDFFAKKKSSPELARKLASFVALEEQPLIMVQCLLDPNLMQKSVHLPDPIWELFCQEQDTSLKQLRNALVNMIAVVLGSPQRVSHLWYLLFSPKTVTASYIPGFMHAATLETGSGVFYNNGVHLSSSGGFSRDDCIKYATRGVLTLHSLYVVLWANFGALCMAMLLLPNAEEAIKGILISSDVPIRQYCLSQLTALWRHISYNLGISHEDRSYLVTRCLENFYTLNSEYLSGDSKDCLVPPTSLEYQEMHESRWQKSIFQPAWKDMQEKHQDLLQTQTFKDLRAMDFCYPYSPSIQEFVHNVLAMPGLSSYCLVAHFILQQPLLQADRILLPVLIELYQWLHIDLAYLVTEEEASKMTFGSAIAEASKHYYSAAGRKDLNALYQQLKESFAKYNNTMDVNIPSMPNKSRHMFVITDETPLIELLSSSEVPGRLYSMIVSIIKCHNDTIDMLPEVARIPHHATLVKHLTSEESSIHPTECKEHTAIMDSSAIFDRSCRFQQLIRRRYQHCTSSSSVSPFYCGSGSILEVPKVPKFDLLKIQEDIAAEYVFGKPRIRDPSTLLKYFCFQKVTSTLSEQAFNQDPANLAQDLANIDEHLPSNFKEELNEEEVSQLESSFHSLTYHLLQEVATGLTTAADLLAKAVNAQHGLKVLPSQTLAHLLVAEYEDKPGNPLVLHNIGIKSLSQSQMKQLMVVGLPLLFDTLQCFVHWIQVGWYDFHSLPLTMKTHLDPHDVTSLRKACKRYSGPIPDLIRELNALMVTLTHTESQFSKLIMKDLDAPIKLYLKERHSISEWENLPALIPDTIKVKHYVNFRIELRRLLDEAHKQVSTPELQDTEWDEVVPDILQSHLHNIPVEIVQQNEHFDPRHREPSSAPELVTDTNQASGGMGTQVADGKKALSGESIETDLTELAVKYTPERIKAFLHDMGMQEYADSFLENEISGDTLIECDSDDEDLIETLNGLGVEEALHRFKILAGFKKKLTEEAGFSPKYNVQKIQGKDPLAEFLKKFNLPPEYQEYFIEKDFDWELLLYVSDSPKNVLMKALPKALAEMGITTALHKTLFKKSFKSFMREHYA